MPYFLQEKVYALFFNRTKCLSLAFVLFFSMRKSLSLGYVYFFQEKMLFTWP
jgi:hypothetical protein